MTNVHINNVFDALSPGQKQADKILERITTSPERAPREYLRKKPLAITCSFLIVFALLIGLFPTLQTGDDNKLEFAFTGLTLTAHAAEINSGTLTFDVQLFEKFDRVEIEVSKGVITLGDSEDTPASTITLRGNGSIVWSYGDKEGAVLSFQGINADGNVISEGSIDMSTGEILVIASYPMSSRNTIDVNGAGIDIEDIIIDQMNQNTSDIAADEELQKQGNFFSVMFPLTDQ